MNRCLFRVHLTLLGLALVVAAPLCVAALIGPIQRTAAGRLGTLQVYRGEPQHGLVFLFSDRDGWNSDLDAAARKMAGMGVVVAGADLPGYLQRLAASNDGCHYVVSEIEETSHRLQREFGFASYRSPILAGVGEGGALVYAALAQSPAATIAGAAAVDRTDTLHTRVPFCPGAASTPVSGGGFAYAPKPSLPGWWVESADNEESPAARAARLVALVASHVAPATPTEEDDLRDLPLTVIPVPGAADVAAIIYSGDGGWRDIDMQIGQALAAAGVPVAGVDCLRYFWSEKRPQRIASDLSRMLRHFSRVWHVDRFLLIGYSFGADILPFAVNRLPAAERARIVQISLLGLSRTASFRISVTGWLGMSSSTDVPILPEAKRLDPARVQCFFGKDESDSLCSAPELKGFERIETSGGHHFGRNYRELVDTIMAGVSRRTGTVPAPTPGGL
jgi:type IV secretory pathway VirJ component